MLYFDFLSHKLKSNRLYMRISRIERENAECYMSYETNTIEQYSR
jgi:hypothetical protein